MCVLIDIQEGSHRLLAWDVAQQAQRVRKAWCLPKTNPCLNVVRRNYGTEKKRRTSLYVDGLRVAEISGEKNLAAAREEQGRVLVVIPLRCTKHFAARRLAHNRSMCECPFCRNKVLYSTSWYRAPFAVC